MKTRLRADGLQRSLHITPVSLGWEVGWVVLGKSTDLSFGQSRRKRLKHFLIP